MPERLIGETLGRYRVEALVGSGGFAWVYRAFDPELEIPVALKVLKPQFAGDAEFEARFRREASTAAKLRHPNIVKIFAVGKENNAVYFAMDFLPRGLADRLEAMPALPEPTVIRAGLDVAKALAFAHREGVVHRDIKVDNILFDDHGNAVVADFGIARAVAEQVRHTATNMVVGTPQYFSPEQARGLDLDGRSDIYSLGVTLYRAAAGRLPFDGDDWYSIARQHVEERPPPIRPLNPAVSADFEGVILRCLAKKPDQRFATADELAEQLEALRHPTAEMTAARTQVMAPFPGSGVDAVAARAATGERRRRLALGGVGAAALVAGGAVALYGRATPPAAPQAGGVATESLVAPRRDSVVAPPSSVATAPPAMATADTSARAADSARRAVPTAVRLTITAPPNAVIAVDGYNRGQGRVSASFAVGKRVRVEARIPNAVAACPTAAVQQTLVIPAGNPTRTVRLTPRPCGTLSLGVRGGPKGGQVTYQVTPRGGASVGGTLPVSGTQLVLPVGTYEVVLEAPGCAQYREPVEIGAEPVSRRPPLLCGKD